jgi:hypothetical protein
MFDDSNFKSEKITANFYERFTNRLIKYRLSKQNYLPQNNIIKLSTDRNKSNITKSMHHKTPSEHINTIELDSKHKNTNKSHFTNIVFTKPLPEVPLIHKINKKNKINIPKIDMSKIISQKKLVSSFSKNGKDYIIVPKTSRRDKSDKLNYSQTLSNEEKVNKMNEIVKLNTNKNTENIYIAYRPKREVRTKAEVLPPINKIILSDKKYSLINTLNNFIMK